MDTLIEKWGEVIAIALLNDGPLPIIPGDHLSTSGRPVAAWLESPGGTRRVHCCGLMSAIGLLALPHGMASVNRLFFKLGQFMPTVIAALVSRQLKAPMKSMQKYLDEGNSPLAYVSPAVFAQLMADQLEAVRAGSQGIRFDMRIVTRP